MVFELLVCDQYLFCFWVVGIETLLAHKRGSCVHCLTLLQVLPNPLSLFLQAFVYRLNPVRIRQGVIWAQLPSFGCPCWMEALVESGEEEESGEGLCECVLYNPGPCGVVSHLNEPVCLCHRNPFSLSPTLRTHNHLHTHMHDSCVWLGVNACG